MGLGNRSSYCSISGRGEFSFRERFSLSEHFLAVVEFFVINEGFTDRTALSLDEGISHTAADDESIALFEEVGNNVELVSNLSTAEDSNERSFRIFNCISEGTGFLSA